MTAELSLLLKASKHYIFALIEVLSYFLVPRIIDLSPLISESGHYVALSALSGTKAAYFINVCRPLEPITGVACPPGSAACEITPGKVAKVQKYFSIFKSKLCLSRCFYNL